MLPTSHPTDAKLKGALEASQADLTTTRVACEKAKGKLIALGEQLAQEKAQAANR